MKILFLSHKAPYPPNKGERLRAYYIIRHLARSHDVHLAALTDRMSDIRRSSEMSKYCAHVSMFLLPKWISMLRAFFGLLTKKPLTIPYFYSRSLDKYVQKALKKEKIDAVYIFSSSMAQYVINNKTVPKIMDFIDCDSEKWEQYSAYARFPKKLIYAREKKLLREYEKEIVRKAEKCVVTTAHEKETFSGFTDVSNFTVVSNGVDEHFYDPEYGPRRLGNTLIFVGAMDYYANIDGMLYFVNEIYPLIKQVVPAVKLIIVGRKPPKVIKRLKRKDPSITVTGYVDEIRIFLSKASVCVIPLRIAQGIQNKILEALAMGLPVVTTSKAAQGFEEFTEDVLQVKDEPLEFAKAVVEFLKDGQLRINAGKMARRYVVSKYTWDNKLWSLDKLMSDLSKR